MNVGGPALQVVNLDVEALTAAVERLLLDPGLVEEMGRAARERAQQEFSAARLVRDTEQLYESLIAGGGSRGM